ncbi:putative transporting ATPase [Marinobacterium lacunae]|uniref:Putative transporting ATPase n=1 Tax=Marinobacterium lacunae TaxID=1232683 RepID=A0A081FWE4_9GAMM|nr:elongation factor P hydroxylase [Marinobacterium lacunae]KEA62849.1 putative transporting ATPase [Marinobacterium lacunae]MBR9883670.1 elongation factor P hydroxylase [Oceanospirillales bacterium]
MKRSHDISDLISIFNGVFLHSHNTELVAGDDEPIYLPADQSNPHHRIIFAHGFFASALHEIAHWCVAGAKRRTLVDFGYWYKPDGRSCEEQAEFERVEVQPQAYEWILSESAGHRFHFSADNLSAGLGASSEFMRNVHSRVLELLEQGLPERVEALSSALRSFYGIPLLTADSFALERHLPAGEIYARFENSGESLAGTVTSG